MPNSVPNESAENQRLDQPLRLTAHKWPDRAVPVVSICCAAYNHEPFIRECLDGFLIQETTFPVEILIHDDASTDGTADIIREYEARYPHLVKPIYQTENHYSKGRKPNLVFNFPRAKGTYIALCEGDDYWTDPVKLQTQVDFLDANQDYVMCYHDAATIDQLGRPIRSSFLPSQSKRDLTSQEMMKAPLTPTPSRVFRNVVQEYPEEMFKVLSADRFHMVVLGKYGKGKYLGQIRPAAYRVHAGGVWSGLDPESQAFSAFNSRLHIYQYHLRSTGKEFAVEFLFEVVFPYLPTLFPDKNPLCAQLRERDMREQRLRDSFTYRVGAVVLWPFQKVRALWRAFARVENASN